MAVIYRLSDIAFLCLKEHAGDVQKPLKLTYYIAGDVQNDSTIARLVEVLGSGEDQQREASTKAWPGYVLSIAGKESSEEKDDARVILGTPTGLAAGYSMLAFHSVGSEANLCLLLVLVDRQSTFLGKTVTSVAITEAEVNLSGEEIGSVWGACLVIAIGDLPDESNSYTEGSGGGYARALFACSRRGEQRRLSSRNLAGRHVATFAETMTKVWKNLLRSLRAF